MIVDFGYKLEGVVPIEQLRQPDGSVAVKAGDSIDVMIDRHGPQPEGYVLLSYSRAAQVRIWDTLERAMREQLLISGHVTERTKGGLMVDVGVPAFMPGSQVDVRPSHDMDSLVGQDIPVKVIKLNRRRGNVVVSRKLALEEDLKARKANALEHLFEGAVVPGVVKNLTEYGAFVDLGGIDGLLHVSDMSHGRVGHPSAVVHVGEEITVKVLKFDREKERISLGIRQLRPDPWETLTERYPPGSRVIGRVMTTHRLRRVRRDRAGRRRPDPHLGNDLEPPHETSHQGGEGGRSGGSGGPGSETARPPGVSRDKAIRSGSMDHGGRPLQHRQSWSRDGYGS